MVRASLLLACFLATLLAPAPDRTAHAEQLLANGDFEAGLSGWQATGGWWSQAPGLGLGGSMAGALTIDPGPSARGYQPLSTPPGGSYQLSGRLLAFDGDVQWAQLSLALRNDGGSPDSRSAGQLFAPGGWSAVIAVPCGMVAVGVEVLVGGDAGGVVYLDDLRLERLASETCAPPASLPTVTALPPPAPAPVPTATALPPAPAPVPTATALPPAPAPVPTATALPPAPGPVPTATALLPAPAPAPTATALPPPPFGPPAPPPTATPASAPAAPPLTPTPSPGLLINGGFEIEEAGMPVAWRSFGGVLTRVSAPVRSGSFAGQFRSSTNATKWVYQPVAAAPARWYELDGYVYVDDFGVAGVLLRISWYASANASGRALATVDSIAQLEVPAGRYRYLTTGPVQAPEEAHSAKVRILLRPASADSAAIYIDDFAFRQTAPGLADSADATLSPEDAPQGEAAGGRSSARSPAGRALAEASGVAQVDGTLSSTEPSSAALPTPVLQRGARTPADSETSGGPATLVVAGVMAALAAGAVALGGAAWYGRRRWRRW